MGSIVLCDLLPVHRCTICRTCRVSHARCAVVIIVNVIVAFFLDIFTANLNPAEMDSSNIASIVEWKLTMKEKARQLVEDQHRQDSGSTAEQDTEQWDALSEGPQVSRHRESFGWLRGNAVMSPTESFRGLPIGLAPRPASFGAGHGPLHTEPEASDNPPQVTRAPSHARMASAPLGSALGTGLGK